MLITLSGYLRMAGACGRIGWCNICKDTRWKAAQGTTKNRRKLQAQSTEVLFRRVTSELCGLVCVWATVESRWSRAIVGIEGNQQKRRLEGRKRRIDMCLVFIWRKKLTINALSISVTHVAQVCNVCYHQS